VASRQQGVAGELEGTTGRAPSNESGGRAHPNSGASVGQRCTVALGGGGAGTVVTDDAAQVLHHGERERRVRWGSRRAEEARASGSPSG
jgi:hypothetical protein